MESRPHLAQVMLLALALCFGACRPEPGAAGLQAPGESGLQPGDLIYRLGNGLYSVYFKEFSRTDKRFSHVGIVVRTAPGGTLRVIHAEADDHTGQGHVRAESLPAFLKGANDWAVYRLKYAAPVRSDVAVRALHYCRRRIPFDLTFDAADSTAFYCTELALHCVNGAAGLPLIRPRTTVQGKLFIAIDDTYLYDEIEPVLQNTWPQKTAQTFCTPLQHE